MPAPLAAAASRSAPEPTPHANAATIYFDNMATTPVDPRVLEAMMPFYTDHFGNASSKTHRFGWTAADAVERAREHVADLIGASPKEIVFTSGATEASNLAIKGLVEAYRDRGNHIISCATEHRAVLDCCAVLERRGYEVTYLPVDGAGRIDMGMLEEAIGERTILVTLMAANNEIGTIHQLEEIGRVAEEREVVWHCDAAQAVGKMPLNVKQLGIGLLSISAHKLYGPKGQGALYVRSKRPPIRLTPQLDGGGQERGLRSGTLDVPGIVGFGRACELCREEMDGEIKTLEELRNRLYGRLEAKVTDFALNGHPEHRLAGCLNINFAGLDGAGLILALQDIALSAGSACTSGSSQPSHVLKAIGRDDAAAFASVRFGIGRFNTAGEVDTVADRVAEEVDRLRQGAPP